MINRFRFLALVSVLLCSPLFAGDSASFSMQLTDVFAKLGQTLSNNLDSSTCLGTPLVVGDITLIPVICKGFGFGFGSGNLNQEEAVSKDNQPTHESSKDRQGFGGGAGGGIKTVAVIVIKKDGTVQIHRLQEGILAGAVKEFIPVLQSLIHQFFNLKALQMKESEKAPPSLAK